MTRSFKVEHNKRQFCQTNVTKLQAFLGYANYYRRYIPNMHELRVPLNNLLKKEIKWDWSDKFLSAFKEIKKVLTSDLSWAHFDPKLEIVFVADASGLGLGAMILHRHEDRKIKPISYTSRLLIAAEKKLYPDRKGSIGHHICYEKVS